MSGSLGWAIETAIGYLPEDADDKEIAEAVGVGLGWWSERGPHEDEDDDEYKETLALLAKKVGEHRRLRAVS